MGAGIHLEIIGIITESGVNCRRRERKLSTNWIFIFHSPQETIHGLSNDVIFDDLEWYSRSLTYFFHSCGAVDTIPAGIERRAVPPRQLTLLFLYYLCRVY